MQPAQLLDYYYHTGPLNICRTLSYLEHRSKNLEGTHSNPMAFLLVQSLPHIYQRDTLDNRANL